MSARIMGRISGHLPHCYYPLIYSVSCSSDAQKGLIGVGLVSMDDKIKIPVLEKGEFVKWMF